MLDPRREAVFVVDRETGAVVDKTRDVARYSGEGLNGKIKIVFRGRAKPYLYGSGRVRIMRDPVRVGIPEGHGVEVDGAVWGSATEVWTFSGRPGAWSRVFYTRTDGEAYSTFPASQVRLIPDAARNPAAADVLGYWREIVARLPDDDPLRLAYARLAFVHPESVLGRYLAAAPIESRASTHPLIFPFCSNLSQREAVEKALSNSISVIEGPPGTGKTETILNLVANIIARAGTVAVVSFSNAAVDNVREKLEDQGFGHVIANLGRMEKREEFLAGQEARNALVTSFAEDAPYAPPPPERVAEVDRRLRRAQVAERTRAQLRAQCDAFGLELQHFERHLERHEVPSEGFQG